MTSSCMFKFNIFTYIMIFLVNASEKDVLEWIEVEKSLVITSVKNSENNLKQSIKASFVKRKFLLELKSKYAGKYW